MKRFFTLSVLLFILSFHGLSQSHINYDKDSRWFLGLNSGITWTSKAEMDYRVRGGYGLVLGYSFNMKPEKLFSWDVRVRFLHAWTAGQDIRRYQLDSSSVGLDNYGDNLSEYESSNGFFVANHKTQLLRGSLELVLNTNRLRERTGLNFYLLGGLGITGYHTSTDLFNDELSASGKIYDYSASNFIDDPTSSNYIKQRDRSYETDLAGTADAFKTDWMPSFGMGISYQFAPYFAMGLEYKQTWTRNNDFDGMYNNIDGSASAQNDIYHYFSGTLKFHLFRGNVSLTKEQSEIIKENPPAPIRNPIVTAPTVKKPIVDITNPSNSPYSSRSDQFTVIASVHNVTGKENITFKQNGVINTNFSYNANSDAFSSNVILTPGQNLFEITATNSAGLDYETTIVLYERPETTVKNPPIVTITNPPYSPYTSNNNIFAFASTVLNVSSKSQIQLYFNGVNVTNFSYNTSTNALNTTLTLMQGANTVTITASNTDGSDSKSTKIIYKRPIVQRPPVVRYIFPAVNPYTSTTNAANVSASVLNVNSKGNITVKINGVRTTAFNYNHSSKQVTFSTLLSEGANIFEITGVNSTGVDSETNTIIYRKRETPRPPIVSFVNPLRNPITVYTSTYNVIASVLNVATKSDITVKINGTITRYFAYSTSSKHVSLTTQLVEGSNVIEISGRNIFGVDIESTTIIYKKPKPQVPPIVTISSPASDGQQFSNPTISLTASVLNVSSKSNITVIVNGVSTNVFNYNIATKVLNLPLKLAEGLNSVSITGKNLDGVATESRTLIYRKITIRQPPAVKWANPSTSPYDVSVDNFVLTATTGNIDTKEQVQLKLNGKLLNPATFTFNASHQIIYNASLTPGNNVFEAIVTNGSGSVEDISVIHYTPYEEPCTKAIFGNVTPTPFSTVENSSINLEAQIKNYSVGTSIELRLNGISQGYMRYNPSSSTAVKTISLSEGSNAISLVVANECGKSKTTFTLNYRLPEGPCSAPVLSRISPAAITTEEEKINFHAVVTETTSKEYLSVTNNNAPVAFNFDPATGNISTLDLPLIIGVNNIKIQVNNECESDEINSIITRKKCEFPEATILLPESESILTTNTALVNAKISNALSGELKLVVNGISQPFSFNEVTGFLNATISLKVGTNLTEIKVKTPCGKVSKRIHLSRKLPCSPITTNLLIPNLTKTTVTNSRYEIKLNARNINAASNINVKLNGTDIDFNYDGITGNIVVPSILLLNGSNNIIVLLKNECSEKTVNYEIIYDGCKAPEILFAELPTGKTVTANSLLIKGKITHVDNPSELTFKVNNKVTDFNYDMGTDIFSANIELKVGVNTLNFLVNGCKTVTKTIIINAKEPCDQIVTSYLSPTSEIHNTTEPIYGITFLASGVSTNKEITIVNNGVAINFNLNPISHVVTIPSINLIKGENNIVASIINSCSSSKQKYKINYNGCLSPVIEISNNVTETSASAYMFKASVSNMSSSSNITATLNGAPVTILYNTETSSILGEVSLIEGLNTIKIVANGCEKVTKEFTVNYTSPCDEITYSLLEPSALELSIANPTTSIGLYAYNVSKEGVSVTVNGQYKSFSFIANRIMIEEVTLKEGQNVITVILKNECSSETISYNLNYANCESPTIKMTSAPINSETESYTFKAIVKNITSNQDLTVKLNGVNQTFSFTPSTGELISTVTLKEGLNEIKFIAKGCEIYQHFFNTTYTIPCKSVDHTLISPKTLNAIVEQDQTNISVLVTNVANKDAIRVALNDSTIIPFTYSMGNINVNGVQLFEGKNEINILFSNACSSEKLMYVIEKAGCKPPSIVLNNKTTSFSTNKFNLSATVLNVSSKNDIKLTMGSLPVPFNYNATTNEVTALLTLKEGENNVTILANSCAVSTGTYTFEYTTPCNPVTYSFLTPSATKQTVESEKYAIQLEATNVVTSDISVKLNGGNIPFTFFNNKVTVSGINLKPGKNLMFITLANECSSESISYSINYNKKEVVCGVRFNPSSSASQFCLITPARIYTRDDLISNPSFTYSGPAKSVYFKAIAGGGSSLVRGAPYSIITGNYYRFDGSITVSINSSAQGMGHWQICVESPSPPKFGVGSKAPTSACRAKSIRTPAPEEVNDGKTTINKDGATKTIQTTSIPVISPISPKTPNVTVNSGTYLYKVKVENVQNKSAIKIFVNNKAFAGFTYSSSTKQLTAVIRLKPGTNIVKVIGTNSSKAVTYSTAVNYSPPKINMNSGTNVKLKINDGSGKIKTNTGIKLAPAKKDQVIKSDVKIKPNTVRKTNTNNSGSIKTNTPVKIRTTNDTKVKTTKKVEVGPVKTNSSTKTTTNINTGG